MIGPFDEPAEASAVGLGDERIRGLRYVKAHDTDLAAQRHYRSVFVGELRTKPGRTRVLVAPFISLGVGVPRVAPGTGAPVRILAAIAFGVAGWLMTATRRRS